MRRPSCTPVPRSCPRYPHSRVHATPSTYGPVIADRGHDRWQVDCITWPTKDLFTYKLRGGNFRKRQRIEWFEISRHHEFGIITMNELPSVIQKANIEVLHRLENDEANRFSWKLTRSLDFLSLTVSCKFRQNFQQMTTVRSSDVLL